MVLFSTEDSPVPNIFVSETVLCFNLHSVSSILSEP